VKVDCLKLKACQYSGNAYLIRGAWNRLEDVNTLIDCGSDSHVIAAIEALPTGLGKQPVETVILTHSHFDHSGGLPAVRQRYQPVVYARDAAVEGSLGLAQGQQLRAGDSWLEVMCVGQHSSDSVCLYSAQDRVFFSGDTPIMVVAPGIYQPEYIEFLERLAGLQIEIVYPGHGQPLKGDIAGMVQRSLRIIKMA